MVYRFGTADVKGNDLVTGQLITLERSIEHWEALLQFSLYFGYVGIMYNNQRLKTAFYAYLERRKAKYALKGSSVKPTGSTGGTNGTAIDPDDDVLSYRIVSGNLNEAFQLDSLSGQLTVANSLIIDFETTPVFELTIEASDGVLTDQALIIINLTDDIAEDFNSLPVIYDQNFLVEENSPNDYLVAMVIAEDADGDVLTYAITSGNSNQAFAIDSKSGAITVANTHALDYEGTPVFNLAILVQDGEGYDDAILRISLIDLDDGSILSVIEAEDMIYPNPSRSTLNIKMKAFKEATLYELSGKEILKSTHSNINISQLEVGVYIVHLQNINGQIRTVKFIKE